MIGRIKWLNTYKGYGEIQDAEENRYYFLLSENNNLKEDSLFFFEADPKSSLFNSPKAIKLSPLIETKKKSKQIKPKKNKDMENV